MVGQIASPPQWGRDDSDESWFGVVEIGIEIIPAMVNEMIGAYAK